MNATSSITLRRGTAYFGYLRSIRIEVDGREIGSLRSREEKTIDLSTGSHKFVARMDWCVSRPLSLLLAANEHKRVSVGCMPFHKAFLARFIPPFVAFELKEISRQS